MDRVRLKALAREAMQKHYWKSVLVSFVVCVATYLALYFISFGASYGFGYSFSMGVGVIATWIAEGRLDTESMFAFGIVSVIFFMVGMCLFATGVAGKAFLVNPIGVGSKKFMCQSLNSEEANLGDLGAGFKAYYKNIAKILFVRDIYIGLWTVLWMGLYMIVGMAILLGGLYITDYLDNVFTEAVAVIFMFFLVLLVYIVCMACYAPIYIKTLHYMFIPYILAEHPEMDRKQAFALSKEMIQGSKWDVFVMHMSFAGWLILGGCTCYILHFLYVAPYMEYTTAAYYEELKKRKGQQQVTA